MTVNINLFNSVWTLLSWLLFTIGLWKLLIKMKWPKPWMACIPGVRTFALASAMDMDREGAICGALEFLMFLDSFLEPSIPESRLGVMISLLMLVFAGIMVVYEIRIFLRLTEVMGVRKRWIILWIPFSWLPMLMFGISSRFQPKELDFTEDWKAGIRPAEVGSSASGVSASDSGLTVNLRERTARDFTKKRYLLKDISLSIPNGTLVLLLGGSGSGKTTLVNAIIGYEKADATVILNGHDVYREYGQMKYRIGFVPQQNLIRMSDTVEHTVADAAKLRLPVKVKSDARHSRIEEVMDLLGLSAGKEGLVAKKSGGQLRRISIAQELVSELELFILDEPDSGLDGVLAREIFTRLRDVADEGKIVIAITHTPDRVVDLFDKVIVLARDSGRVGRLAFYGSPQAAREFFGKETMEGIVMSVNREEEGGEGRADELIARYAAICAEKAHPGSAEETAAPDRGEEGGAEA